MKLPARLFMILGLVIVCVLGLSFCLATRRCQEERILELEADLSLLQEEFIPLEFQIKERSGSEIRLRLKLLDAEYTVLHTADYTLAGDELMLDFLIVEETSGAFLVFPDRIYTDQMAPASGIPLRDNYLDASGFPLIYQQDSVGEPEKRRLIDVVQALWDLPETEESTADEKLSENENRIYGNVVHDVKELSRFSTGLVYQVVCHTRGGIEIQERK